MHPAFIDYHTRQEIAKRLVEMATPFYDQPHRHYHTIEHVKQMFKDANEMLEWKLHLYEMIAIAFHDAIWVAGCDEQCVHASANLVGTLYTQGHFDWLGEYDDGLSADVVGQAIDTIRDTFKHLPHADVDSSRVIDLDMIGFSLANRQLKILAQLTKEYNEFDFATGREQFLMTMLNRKPFFYNLSDSDNALAYSVILNELQILKGNGKWLT